MTVSYVPDAGAVLIAPGCRWQLPGVGQWCWICWRVMADRGIVPSSASVADGATWMASPTLNVGWFGVTVTVNTGGLLRVLMDSVVVPVAPSWSVTVSV